MGGGLMGLIRMSLEDDILRKNMFATSNDLHWYFSSMNTSGLGVIDEHVDYFISELEKLPQISLFVTDHNDDTLLHEVCRRSFMCGGCFSHRLFSYLIGKGLDIKFKNKEGKTCIDLLNERYQSDSDSE